MVMGSLYSACIFLGVSNSSSVQPVVSVERTVYYRERAAKMYSSLPYAVAQVLSSFMALYDFEITVLTLSNCLHFVSHVQGLVEIPYILAQTCIFGIITYFMINYERSIG